MTHRNDPTDGTSDADGINPGAAIERAIFGAEQDKPRLQLTGTDGNAIAVLGAAWKAAKEAGWGDDRWQAVRDEATTGDYNHLLATIMDAFDVH
jgi:hypothetical protein